MHGNKANTKRVATRYVKAVRVIVLVVVVVVIIIIIIQLLQVIPVKVNYNYFTLNKASSLTITIL